MPLVSLLVLLKQTQSKRENESCIENVILNISSWKAQVVFKLNYWLVPCDVIALSCVLKSKRNKVASGLVAAGHAADKKSVSLPSMGQFDFTY